MHESNHDQHLEPEGHARPLRLSRETLRELDDLELEQVAGGKHKETHSCKGGCGHCGSGKICC